MSLHEKTVYPQLVAAFAAEELERHFTPTAEELEFANKGARSNGSRLTLLTLLKLFQVLHRFPAPSEVPAAIVQHIRIHLGIGDDVMLENNDAVQCSVNTQSANIPASHGGTNRLVTWRWLRVMRRRW